MKTQTYNGHRNWRYWNVSLWINNDEGLYSMAREAMRMNNGHRMKAARDLVAMLPAKTPDGAKYSVGPVSAALDGME